MKLQISLALLLGASTLFANESLITKAKNAGLEAIPSNKQVLMKLIDDPKDPITDSKVELGKKLYFDPRLSRSNLISCNTCHNLALGGADTVPAASSAGVWPSAAACGSPRWPSGCPGPPCCWGGRHCAACAPHR